MTTAWFEEELYPDWRQRFRIGEIVYQAETDHQKLVIFDTPTFGRVLALDGVIQVTEGDEFVYHEMLAHTTMLAHGDARNVLIIGGGDGGLLREVLKHPVERAVMVEIDNAVVETCRQHLPGISAGAFDDPSAEIVIADGLRYVAETDRRFDVIIIDSTDPIGPGAGLFSEAFYADCGRILTPRGIIATQNGVPFRQAEELKSTHGKFLRLFPDTSFFMAAVPSYVGGAMALGWASRAPENRRHSVETIRQRYQARAFPTRYWTPEVHVASFALPRYVQDMLADAAKP